MRRAKPPSRRALWALWLCVLTLLAKAAMPFLASASAEWQGRALVEVCTVYGVSTVAVGTTRHDSPGPLTEPAAGHGAEHCALSALTAFAGGDPHAVVVPVASQVALPAVSGAATAPVEDASARWAARLRHGPPRTT